jgi:transposase
VLNLSGAVKLWCCPTPVDGRLGYDGLYALVRSRLMADPLSGHLFLFHNNRADRLKVLYWGGHGLCLFCQRLERGRYHFPKPPDGACAVEMTLAQFHMLLEGIDLAHPKRFRRFSPPAA